MSKKTRTTGNSEKRFGVVAVEKGFITPDQLFAAMKLQVQDDLERGTHRLLGEILFEQGAITPSQIGEVLEVLRTLRSVFG